MVEEELDDKDEWCYDIDIAVGTQLIFHKVMCRVPRRKLRKKYLSLMDAHIKIVSDRALPGELGLGESMEEFDKWHDEIMIKFNADYNKLGRPKLR